MKKTRILLVSSLIISLFLISSVYAACNLNLPATPVNMVAVDGSNSYFDITLSGVPVGFDVTNRVYLGWCIDIGVTHPRGSTFAVMLYSSCDPPTSPSLDGYEWDKINYILNNKGAATPTEIQEAIWDYINLDGPYATTNAGAIALIAAAEAGGDGFVPGPGDVVAVILIPEDIAAQATIIELRIPEKEGLSPGFWKHNLKVYLELTRGRYSVPHEGEPRIDGPTLEAYLATIGVSAPDAYDTLTTRGPGSEVIRLDMANAFNSAAGYTPYSD